MLIARLQKFPKVTLKISRKDDAEAVMFAKLPTTPLQNKMINQTMNKILKDK